MKGVNVAERSSRGMIVCFWWSAEGNGDEQRKQDENVVETNESERAIVLQWLIRVCRSIYRR